MLTSTAAVVGRRAESDDRAVQPSLRADPLTEFQTRRDSVRYGRDDREWNPGIHESDPRRRSAGERTRRCGARGPRAERVDVVALRNIVGEVQAEYARAGADHPRPIHRARRADDPLSAGAGP